MQRARTIQLSEANPGIVRFLSGFHVTLEEGKTTSWVTVTRTGNFQNKRYGKFSITRQMLLSMVDNFNKDTYGQQIFVDKAHKSGEEAAGNFLQLKVEGDRLRALVEWTPYGIDLIKNKGMKYLSAEYHENYTDNEAGNTHGTLLMGAGLTTRPEIKRLDPIELSESGDGDVPVLLHPELQSTLLAEITDMHKTLIVRLLAALTGMKLAEPVVKSLTETFEKAVASITDETAAKALMDSFEESGKQLAAQIGDRVVQLSIAAPDIKQGLSADDVKKLLAEENQRVADAAKALAEKTDANVKLLADTINAASGIDDQTKKELADSVSDLITPEMTADQVKKLANTQIAMGNKLASAKQLAAMGYQWPAGNVHISVDSSNEIKALQEAADTRLGLTGMPENERFANTGGQLQTKNKKLAEQVLAQYDVLHGAQLHAEHRMLAAGDGKVSDVAVPATFERTVIREALYRLVGLQFVDTGVETFSATTQIPYSYRDTTAAGRSNTRVYEGGSVPRAGVKQTMDTAYVIPQKLAFEVSDEMRYLTSNGQLNWDVVSENASNAFRIIGEDLEKLIFDEQLNASDQYATTAVTNEAVATADGTKTIFKLAQFPVVRPKKIYDLQGNQVGSTLYGVTVSTNGTARSEYDGTGTQAAGLYYTIDYNIGEISFVSELGVATAPSNTHAIVASYTYTTNVYKFDTDLGSLTQGAKWDDFIYRFGLRKSIVEDQRYHMCNFGLMSGTVMTSIEQADSFVESRARVGTSLSTEGNLGVIKNVPQFKAFAPGLAMGDQRVIIGERNQTRLRMAKPWTMGELIPQRDSNGRFTGKKEAMGDQFLFLHTPTPLKSALTSIVLYSSSARVNR